MEIMQIWIAMVNVFKPRPQSLDYYQSTNQAAYGFINPISINGEVAQGWENNQDECISNPYSCDVIGAFHNDTCVGWNYISPENNDTVMGNNTIDSQTLNYLEVGDIPIFYIFDSSTHEIYLLSDNFVADPYSDFAFNISFDVINAVKYTSPKYLKSYESSIV